MLLSPHLFNPNFGGVPVAPDRPCWASTGTWTLSYSAVKLFSSDEQLSFQIARLEGSRCV